ncbi:MAG: FAD-dependent oxidoreductase [Burkholderiaceae bacterium]
MNDTSKKLSGPDLCEGVALSAIAKGSMLLGHAHGEPVLMVHGDTQFFAVGASCTHYGGPLADGLIVGDTVRCPWHHACFSLDNGAALRAPALNPIACWQVEQRGDRIFVGEKRAQAVPQALPDTPAMPAAVVIVGGGAAGNAAAEMLRREGYAGRITMLSADASRPYDRPNLSKGYLAGTAPASYNPLRSPAFYVEHNIDLQLNVRVAAIDTAARQVTLEDGSAHAYDALLLATGAEPVKLDIPGSALPHVHDLRTQADSDALIASALTAQRAVVIGASFIGLEVAAALRKRNIAVDVVGLETCPMEKVLGREVGNFFRQVHEAHGVTFHLGTSAAAIDERSVSLHNGESLSADLVVIGIGVRPALALAQQAGLAIEHGVTVNAYLETSVPGIFAAGDIARWPDRLSGESIRVEHWALAERQGQTAARNMLGQRERFEAVPFFWTEQYDFNLAYVGHASVWDSVTIDGQLDAASRDFSVTYRSAGQKLAIASVYRDLESLRAELELEQALGNRPSAPGANA